MKTGLIIKREYLTRVKKRSFIITTLLLPLIFIGFSVFVGYMATKSSSEKNIVIKDDTHFFEHKLKSTKSIKFNFSNQSLDSLKSQLSAESFDGLLYIPAVNLEHQENLNLYSNKQLGFEVEEALQSQMNDAMKVERMKAAGIDEQQLENANRKTISIQTKVGKEEKNSSSEIAMGIGYACGILLYLFMLLYGLGVMRSVMEEKTNRIAEIIISSVKPFQLMMGKIIGVALVGLTQVLIWIVFIGIVFTIFSPMMKGAMSPADATAMTKGAANPEMMEMVKTLAGNVNWLGIAGWFLFYFLGGYFLYAALFAAVGSLVNEDQQDAQQFTTLITMPIIFGFILMTAALKDPNSNTAIFGSIFPLTSPIVMMARIPFGVPVWQIIASVVCLVLGFILTTLLASKIYRTGILMYGKKVTFKELGKWIVRKS